jgi:hypothetical protein
MYDRVRALSGANQLEEKSEMRCWEAMQSSVVSELPKLMIW